MRSGCLVLSTVHCRRRTSRRKLKVKCTYTTRGMVSCRERERGREIKESAFGEVELVFS